MWCPVSESKTSLHLWRVTWLWKFFWIPCKLGFITLHRCILFWLKSGFRAKKCSKFLNLLPPSQIWVKSPTQLCSLNPQKESFIPHITRSKSWHRMLTWWSWDICSILFFYSTIKTHSAHQHLSQGLIIDPHTKNADPLSSQTVLRTFVIGIPSWHSVQKPYACS